MSSLSSSKIDWNKIARNRKPEEWKALLEAIPDPLVRVKVACVVWFDCMPKECGPEWSFLSDLVAQYNQNRNPSLQDEMHGLIAVGFPDDVAYKRVSTDKRQGKKDSERMINGRLAGPGALLAAFAMQAVDDIRYLSEAGVVVNGDRQSGWPFADSKKIRDYKDACEVDQLLDFITEGGFQILFDNLGVNKSAEDVMDLFGLKRRDHRMASRTPNVEAPLIEDDDEDEADEADEADETTESDEVKKTSTVKQVA